MQDDVFEEERPVVAEEAQVEEVAQEAPVVPESEVKPKKLKVPKLIAYSVGYEFRVIRKSDSEELMPKVTSKSIVHSNAWKLPEEGLKKNLSRSIAKKIASDLKTRVTNGNLHSEAIRSDNFTVEVVITSQSEYHPRVTSMESFREQRNQRK